MFPRRSSASRKQFIINVLHLGRPNVSKAELKEKLARLYEVRDPNAIFVFKFRTQFGGGKSTDFGLIYDSFENAKKYEPKYRLIKNGWCSRRVCRVNSVELDGRGRCEDQCKVYLRTLAPLRNMLC
ncbi:hypothetical protein ACFX2I_002611 [Malus domestica]